MDCNLLLFLHLFFLFHLSTLFILKNSLRDFLQVFFNQVIPILWLVNKFGLLTQIFYWSFFIYLCSVLSFKISFFLTLRFIIFLVFISIRLSHSYDPANKVWKPYLYLQLFYFLGLFLLTIFFYIIQHLDSWVLVIIIYIYIYIFFLICFLWGWSGLITWVACLPY